MAKESKRGFELRRILAENLRRLRKALGLSQEGFAERCSLHRTYVGSVERRERNVTLSSLDAFAIALKIQPAELLSTIEDDQNSTSHRRKHSKAKT